MKSCAAVVRDPLGLHARPAMLLVETASRFESDIALRRYGDEAGTQADAKRIFDVLKLDVDEGERIELIADGPDEDEALAALAILFF